MSRIFFYKKFSFQMIAAVTVTFMFLNALLPLNLSSVETEAIHYPFRLMTSLENATYNLREPINIPLYLENIGNENVTLEYPTAKHFDFVIYDKNFNQIYRLGENRGFVAIWLPPRNMEPGETINATLTWYQETGWEVISRVGQPDFEIRYYWAEPSNYYVIGIFTSATYDINIQTPAMRITII